MLYALHKDTERGQGLWRRFEVHGNKDEITLPLSVRSQVLDRSQGSRKVIMVAQGHEGGCHSCCE